MTCWLKGRIASRPCDSMKGDMPVARRTVVLMASSTPPSCSSQSQFAAVAAVRGCLLNADCTALAKPFHKPEASTTSSAAIGWTVCSGRAAARMCPRTIFLSRNDSVFRPPERCTVYDQCMRSMWTLRVAHAILLIWSRSGYPSARPETLQCASFIQETCSDGTLPPRHSFSCDVWVPMLLPSAAAYALI